jgi:hypothetical protein
MAAHHELIRSAESWLRQSGELTLSSMSEINESVFHTDVHGRVAVGIDFTSGICGGMAGILVR